MIADTLPPLPHGIRVFSPTAQMSEASINRYVQQLNVSLLSMPSELGFRVARETFTPDFFLGIKDSGFKMALTALLTTLYGDRLPLWGAIQQRDPSVLDLI